MLAVGETLRRSPAATTTVPVNGAASPKKTISRTRAGSNGPTAQGPAHRSGAHDDRRITTLREESAGRAGGFWVPRFELSIDGVSFDNRVLRDVVEITYKDSIDQIDGFEMVVGQLGLGPQPLQIHGLGGR